MHWEGRTMSELIREAHRSYMEERGVALNHPVREAPRSPCRAGRFSGRFRGDNMKKQHLQPPMPADLYPRVSTDTQDVDLSVSAHSNGRIRTTEGLSQRWYPAILASDLSVGEPRRPALTLRGATPTEGTAKGADRNPTDQTLESGLRECPDRSKAVRLWPHLRLPR